MQNYSEVIPLIMEWKKLKYSDAIHPEVSSMYGHVKYEFEELYKRCEEMIKSSCSSESKALRIFKKNYIGQFLYHSEDGFYEQKRIITSALEALRIELDESHFEREGKKTKYSNKIFIVHGHNGEIKTEVARVIEKLGLIPIILHEQANMGRTIIEKFEANSDVGFAIVLLTDDDLGKAKTENSWKKRARQNVVMELGYFIGQLGRDRVCPLYVKGVELPSDMDGILFIKISRNKMWKIELVKELQASGYQVNANDII